MWVFGYGSILWKVDFPTEKQLIGYIKGYTRRFYQNSTDHRGTPEKPGRVVTLIPSVNNKDQVWGIAYSISTDKVNDVVKHLDFRERGGYERKSTLFYPKDDPCDPFEITIYVATETNKQYAGPTTINKIAEQIITAVGPSGANVEYVFKLASVMREIAPGVNDEHLFAVENAVRNILSSSYNPSNLMLM